MDSRPGWEPAWPDRSTGHGVILPGDRDEQLQDSQERGKAHFRILEPVLQIGGLSQVLVSPGTPLPGARPDVHGRAVGSWRKADRSRLAPARSAPSPCGWSFQVRPTSGASVAEHDREPERDASTDDSGDDSGASTPAVSIRGGRGASGCTLWRSGLGPVVKAGVLLPARYLLRNQY